MSQRPARPVPQALGALLDGSGGPLGRSERRHWADVYVRGLLLDGERKSIEPLAARVPDGNVQALQQLVGQSPWEWLPVWERLAQRMTLELEPEAAWVVDDTGFPKQGAHSVGVARQYSGTLGKVGNCQVAVSCTTWGSKATRCWTGACTCRSAGPRIPPGARPLAFRTRWSFSPSGSWAWT